MFGAMTLDLSVLESSPVYTLPVPQVRIVAVLAERAVELGAEIRRGHEVTGLAQALGDGGDGGDCGTDGGTDEGGVTVDVAAGTGPYRIRARYLVGAEGAHSVTRKRSGIGFPGVSYDRRTTRIAHATVPRDWIDPETRGLRVPGRDEPIPAFLPLRTERGALAFAPFSLESPMLSTTEWAAPDTEQPMTLGELAASISRVLGAEVPLGPPTGEGPHALRRLVGGHTRVAERFRDRRVFLIGDAAHVYTAGGGPGLNLGLQDAVNLGWKLAAALHGRAPDGLLDSYDTERRAAARRMVTYSQAQSALQAPGSDVTALRELFGELLADRDTVQRLADLTAGTDVRYAMGEDGADTHPLVGRLAPELELRTAEGEFRLAELARTGRALLLDLTEDASPAGALSVRGGEEPGFARVDIHSARPRRPGARLPATALLLRPDGYVAWASSAPSPAPAELDALRAAARRWLGFPASARPASAQA